MGGPSLPAWFLFLWTPWTFHSSPVFVSVHGILTPSLHPTIKMLSDFLAAASTPTQACPECLSAL